MNGRNQISVATAGDARRAQIVHAAREICLEKGFSKITVSDIAGRVGMTLFPRQGPGRRRRTGRRHR